MNRVCIGRWSDFQALTGTKNMSYWTNTVAEMTGIPKNTLIAWERRYGLVSPERTESGYRLYTDSDVRLLLRVKELLDDGYRISEVVRLLTREPGGTPLPEPQAGTEAGGLEGLRDRLLSRLLDFDLDGAEQISRAFVTLPFETLLDEVYLPLLQEVGERWERSEATVVQEHFVSGWCRERILAMARRVEPGAPGAPEAFCGTAQGERHEFGALGVAFHLANRGYRVLYLGADVPTSQLLELIAERRPALVAVSAVLERKDLDLVDYGNTLLAALGDEGKVLIGGRAGDKLEDRSTDRLLFGTRAAQVVARGATRMQRR